MGSSSKNTQTIHIRLLDEPVEVWRPTLAEMLEEGVFHVLPTSDYDPDDETWEFLPGSNVLVEVRQNEEGIFLAATKAVNI